MDMWECLPDELMASILERLGYGYSELPFLVSKRWYRICSTLLPNVSFGRAESEATILRAVRQNLVGITHLCIEPTESTSFPSDESLGIVVDRVSATLQSFCMSRLGNDSYECPPFMEALRKCKQLQWLNMVGFNIRPPFPVWRHLTMVALDLVTLTLEHVEDLVAACPCLKTLELDAVRGEKPLQISSGTIKRLRLWFFDGEVGKDLILTHMKRLEHLEVNSFSSVSLPRSITNLKVLDLVDVVGIRDAGGLKWVDELTLNSLCWETNYSHGTLWELGNVRVKTAVLHAVGDQWDIEFPLLANCQEIRILEAPSCLAEMCDALVESSTAPPLLERLSFPFVEISDDDIEAACFLKENCKSLRQIVIETASDDAETYWSAEMKRLQEILRPEVDLVFKPKL